MHATIVIIQLSQFQSSPGGAYYTRCCCYDYAFLGRAHNCRHFVIRVFGKDTRKSVDNLCDATELRLDNM